MTLAFLRYAYMASTCVATGNRGPKKAGMCQRDQKMNRYAISAAIIGGGVLAACGGNSDDLMSRAKRDRDSQAIARCQDYARSHATHPSTVDFSIRVARVAEQPDGSVIVGLTFTAKNGFGTELKFEVACQVNGQGIVDAAVREAIH